MKKDRIRLDKIFNKQELLLLKNYERITAICIENSIPYNFVNRCYKRYVKKQKEKGLEYNKSIFENAIKIYLVAEKDGYKYNPNTRGEEACEIANECGLASYNTYVDMK